ncbi:MAG: 2-amino-4-hydroxy-6-hydroxymethyldihydropteridine diphosphokinase [Bacteroidales bacterium]|nr:2-amino-4-hydroxy-6-hydroxymethyldihydropteridine diphosphokinase [Bacteroidales bacterium]
MKTETVYLGLGSNLGDRRANIEKALELLDEAVGTHWEALSSIIETPAQGFDGPPFLNCAVRYRYTGTPHRLLDACQRIERRLGRRKHPLTDALGRRIYESRPIDIDILLYGERKIDAPRLTVPHPRMQERDFVMRPLREIFDRND